MEKPNVYYGVFGLAIVVYVCVIACKLLGLYESIPWIWLLVPLWFPLLFLVILFVMSVPLALAKIIIEKCEEEEG